MLGREQRPRILVIDPDGEIEALINQVAEDLNCEIVGAESDGLCHDTFSFLIPFALAVMAISERTSHLSKMIPLIRRLSPNAEFILLSRAADDRMWADALANGAHDVFAIPADQREVRKAISKALNPEDRTAASPGAVNAA